MDGRRTSRGFTELFDQRIRNPGNGAAALKAGMAMLNKASFGEFSLLGLRESNINKASKNHCEEVQNIPLLTTTWGLITGDVSELSQAAALINEKLAALC